MLYASDFPHEPDDEIVEVLEAFLAREDVSQAAKQKILTLERDAKSGTYIITSIEGDRAA